MATDLLNLLQAPDLSAGGGFGLPPDLGAPTVVIPDLTAIAPITVPTDPFAGAPVVIPPPLPPIDTLAPPVLPPTPPPDLTGILPPVGLPPIGYDPFGNPIYSVTNAPPVPPIVPTPPPQPVLQQPPVLVTSTSSGGTATATAIASINQNIQIMNQDVQPLADAVKAGITAGTQAASDIAQQTTATITQQLGSFSNSLFGWVKDFFRWIGDNIGNVVRAIANEFENIAKIVFNVIREVGSNIVNWFQNTVGPVLTSIGDALNKVATYYQQHIEPILRTLAQVIQTTQAAVVAIEKDISSGLQGILRLPGDLATALSSIGNELIRAGIALRVHKAEDADFYYVTQDGRGFAEHIKGLSDAISGKAPVSEKTTYSPGPLLLSEPTLAQELPAMIDIMNVLMGDVAKAIKNIVGDPAKLVEAVGIGAIGGLIELAEPFEAVKAIWDVMKAPFDVIGELAAERVREGTMLSKLDPATLAQLWRRGFITIPSMDAEMAVQGYNQNRSELLRRLTTHVEDVSSLVDFLYRGVIVEDDFVSGLHDLGFTDPQIAALREGSSQLLDITTVLTAWRRGDVDEAQVDATFAVNRWNDAERDLIKGLTFAPANYGTAYQYALAHRALNFFNIGLPALGEIPDVVKNAGRSDGLSDNAILQQWTAAVNTLPAQAWLTLYWRGQATKEEVKEALLRDRVPLEMADNWIDAQRPIIPFRTVPGLVAANIISESDAIAYLQKHGYSLDDAVLLMKYATRGSKASKATTAATQHSTSLATARQAFDDGIIDDSQYLALLKEHGLDDSTAQLDLQLAKITLETKARKQLGVDIVNEFQAGLIDQAQALRELANSGYTIAEQAAVQKKLKSAGAAKAKLPSEAELRSMAAHDIITPDDYESTLVTTGYSAIWAARFRQLHFPPLPA